MNASTRPEGVSVVIPTINRAVVLLDTIGDLLKQDFESFEIIVVDQSEEINERALELLRASSVPSRYYKAYFRGLPQARNFGWQQARFDVVLYVDDDIRTDTNLVRRHFDAHVRTGAALIAGGIDEAKGDQPSRNPAGSFGWWTATPHRNFASHRAGWCLHVPGGNFSVRREVIEEIGGIDEVLSIGAALYEEGEASLRARAHGYKAWFAPEARLTHLAAPMGGCRVERDWPQYMYGLAHNRAILIFRYLRPWHRPTATARLFMLGLSYSRLNGTMKPLAATMRGFLRGRLAARRPPVVSELRARECISS